MGTVDSDAIKKIGFSGVKNQKGVLRIEFADGSAVDYLDVGYSMYRKVVMSSSHGKFYNDHIRGSSRQGNWFWLPPNLVTPLASFPVSFPEKFWME